VTETKQWLARTGISGGDTADDFQFRHARGPAALRKSAVRPLHRAKGHPGSR
jgi:hypothetical protein